VYVPGECPLLLPSCVRLPLVLTAKISVRLQELGFHKPSLPPVPEDAVDRAARRVAAEKKDAEKVRARERMRARNALERRRRQQERDVLPREPSPETPDDDDDDEDDDMATRLGLSPDLWLGQGSSSQPPSGLAPSVSRAGVSGSRSEEQGQAKGVLDPPVPEEPLPVPAAQEADPQVAVSAPGRTVPSAPWAPEAGMVPKPAAGQTLVVPAGTEA
jgi:hypothetical protein